MAKRPSFSYTPRTREEMQKRARQYGNTREGFIKEEFKIWTPTAGEHRIRILPATWDNNEHYGLDVYAHYNIGPEGSSFVCLHNPPVGYDKEECSCCEEKDRAGAAGEEDLERALRPNKRVCVWMIDRDQQSAGLQIWPMPYTVDRDIAQITIDDDKGGGVLSVDDPENGYDVQFKRDGTNQYTRYTGIKLARRETPLSDDPDEQEEWLQFVADHPLTECVLVAEADHMAKAVSYGVKARPGDRDDDNKDERPPRRGATSQGDAPPPRRGRAASSDDPPPRRGRTAPAEDDAPPPRRSASREPVATRLPATYEELAALSEDEMLMIADEENIKIDERDELLPQLAEAFGFADPYDTPEPAPARRGRAAPADDPPPRRTTRAAPPPDDDPPPARSRPRMTKPADDPEPTRAARRPAEGGRVNRLRSGMSNVRGK